MNKFLKILLTIINILLALLLFFFIGISIFRPKLLEDMLIWVTNNVNYLGNWNYLIVFITAFIESFPVLGIIIPGQNIMLIIGGFFTNASIGWMIIIAIGGAIAGNYAGYILGKYWGEPFFHNYGEWFGLGKTEVKYLSIGIQTHGFWIVVVGKFHNFLRSFVPFVAGSVQMQTNKFMGANLLGSVLRAFIIILLGVMFEKYYKILISYSSYIILAIFIGITSYIYFFKKNEFKKYLAEKIDEK